jgi:hypothetical protein
MFVATSATNSGHAPEVVSHNLLQHHDGTGHYHHDQDLSEDGSTLPGSEGQDEEVIEARVGDLARRLTRQSTRFSMKNDLQNPFTVEDAESILNPNSPIFSPKEWMKMLLAIRSRDKERYPDRTAGVAFENLSVHGYGSPTDYQKDVLNSLLEGGTLIRKLMGMKMQRIQILREFDGLVKSGEMLLVLGRPGSGCTTFLKTISGEMNGIEMSEGSMLNYQGILSFTTPHCVVSVLSACVLLRYTRERDAQTFPRRGIIQRRNRRPLSAAHCRGNTPVCCIGQSSQKPH